MSIVAAGESGKKILFIFQEVLMKHVLREVDATRLDRKFFESGLWAARPNSTSRLNLANYQALTQLQGEHQIEFACVNSVDERLASQLRGADVIVMNQVSSPGSRAFLSEFLRWLAENPIKGKVVFGTELSWFGEVAQDRGVTQEMLDAAYFGHVLLRHTAKTEAALYASESCHDAVIQEFEIGLDTDFISSPKPVAERRVISFVRAPEGRSTKNNAAIERIAERIRRSEALAGYEVRVIEPPYSSLDYWTLMGESAFFVFTSLGETFSYCLNDAKSCGAVAFHPEQMYYTAVGLGFASDSYPRSGIKYSSDDDLILKLERLASSPDDLEAESRMARDFVVSEFSTTALAGKWSRLFSGESLNTETLYIYDAERMCSWQEVAAACCSHGARFAMPFMNATIPNGAAQGISWHDRASDVVLLKYYLSAGVDGAFRRVILKDERGLVSGQGAVAKHLAPEAARFLQLQCRQNKISRIVVDASLENPVLDEALGKLRYFAGLTHGLRNIEVRRV